MIEFLNYVPVENSVGEIIFAIVGAFIACMVFRVIVWFFEK